MSAEKLCDLLTRAVNQCIHPDDRVALFLSGGLDSAIIQAIAGVRHIYCITWPEEDNLKMAGLAARDRAIKTVTFTKGDMMQALPEVARLTGGRGTWSQICQYFAAGIAADDGCSVVLTGEGADELFGGYSRYKILYWLDRMYTDPKLDAYREIAEYLVGNREHIVNRMLARTSRLRITTPPGGSLVRSMAREEEQQALPRLLAMETAVIETHGLRVQYPFMDSRVVNYAHDLPPQALVTEFETKHILRDAARLLGVHPEIVNETTKKGLFIPQHWRPEGEPKWSRRWFEELMEKAMEKAA